MSIYFGTSQKGIVYSYFGREGVYILEMKVVPIFSFFSVFKTKVSISKMLTIIVNLILTCLSVQLVFKEYNIH